MLANLIKNKILLFGFGIICLFVMPNLWAQDCNQDLDFSFAPLQNNTDFNQFPDFKLPFTIIYGGSSQVFSDEILKKGFSHIANTNPLTKITPAQKAYIFYNVADAGGQPWKTHKSPFGNDLEAYFSYWNDRLEWIKQENGGNLDFDIFCLDIEHHLKSREEILELKNKDFIPDSFGALDDDAFFKTYLIEMQKLYAETLNFFRNKVNANYFTSYGDAPIFNTFTNIQGPDWESWQNDPSLIHFLSYDFENNKVGGPFYEQLDLIAPSAYFYYDYPHLFAGEYLSYLLFQLEANRARTDKGQILFLWNRYSFTPGLAGQNIQPWMAESMAIFPFFGGAKGVWLWDDPTDGIVNHEGYQYYVKGLYRLSKFSHFFEGNFELIETISARDYNENKQPIWRGVLKDNQLLVAVHNPYAASENEEVEITINYKSLNKKIKLKGYETFLCSYEIPLVTSNENERVKLKVYPNPGIDFINYEIYLNGDAEVSLVDDSGRIIHNEIVSGYGIFVGKIDIKDLHANKLYFHIKTASYSDSQTIIIQ